VERENGSPPKQDGSPPSASAERRRQRRRKRSGKKKPSARVRKALETLGWIALGLAIGLPVLAGLLYMAGR
jgi:hypothetical protein